MDFPALEAFNQDQMTSQNICFIFSRNYGAVESQQLGKFKGSDEVDTHNAFFQLEISEFVKIFWLFVSMFSQIS